MARGRKTSDEKTEQVKALLMINPNASGKEISKIVKIPERTAYDIKNQIINEDPDTFAELRNRKKEEFIAEAWEVVKKAMLATNLKIDDLINDPESLKKANIRDIAVALGTIYDKQALAAGEPTQITERKEPTPELVQELQQKVIDLRKLTGT